MKDNGKEILSQLKDSRALLLEAKKVAKENGFPRWVETIHGIVDDVSDQIRDIERMRDNV